VVDEVGIYEEGVGRLEGGIVLEEERGGDLGDFAGGGGWFGFEELFFDVLF